MTSADLADAIVGAVRGVVAEGAFDVPVPVTVWVERREVSARGGR